jgi:hypothetical protein
VRPADLQHLDPDTFVRAENPTRLRADRSDKNGSVIEKKT